MVAITALNKIAEAGTGSSLVTSSLTPTVSRLYLLSVVNRENVGAATTPTATGGGGLTWVQVATIETGDAPSRRITILRALKTSGLTSGTVTVDFGGASQTQVAVSIDEFAGVDTTGTDGSGAIVQSATNSGSDVGSTVTLSAFADAVNNAAFAANGHGNNNAVTPEAGYTELSDQTPGNSTSLQTQWKLGEDLTVTSSWTGSNTWNAIAAELKAAAAPPTSLVAAGRLTRNSLIRRMSGILVPKLWLPTPGEPLSI